jgi:hypothetical protein
VAGARDPDDLAPRHPFLPVRVRLETGELCFFTATAEIGTAQAISVRDLHLELFFPADAATQAYFDAMATQKD